MRAKLGLGTVTKVSLIIIILIIVAVAGIILMSSFQVRAPPTSSSTETTTATSSTTLITITTIKTTTQTTSSATLKLPETRSYFSNIFDLFGNFSTMTVTLANSTSSPVINSSSIEILTYSLANLTSTASNVTAVVGFNYNYTSISNGVRETFTNVSIAFLQMAFTNQTPTFSLVDSNGTIYSQQAAQVVGDNLIGPFYYAMGVGLPIESTQYSSSQSGLAQQSFADFALPETIYSLNFSGGNSATAVVGYYPPSYLLLISYRTAAGWSYKLTGARSG